MDRSDENSMVINRQENIQGGHAIGGGKALLEVGRTRRALSTINPNVVGQNPQGMGNKRGLGKEKQVVPAKVIQANRPMTRKRAAELAKNQQHSLVETHGTSSSNQNPNESSLSNQNSSESDDCLIIDVEEYQAANNSKGPMKEEEERFDEIDEMDEDQLEEHDEIEEDEMEEIVPRPVRKAVDIVGGQSVRKGVEPIRRDIDGNDRNNPLAVVEYVKDIYSFHKDNENSGRVPSNYMDEQDDINGRMRAILIDWLIEVHYKFDLMDETLFLMVNLIDRFLARKVVERKKLQLVGVTALLLACKYEEISVPVVEDLIVITDRAYTRKEVLDMEKLIVNTLQFNMSVPTPYVFMMRFLKVVQSDRRLELLSFFILELCLVEYEMLQFSPSLLAAAAIFTAQCTINRFKHWNSTSEWHTTYSEDELLECSKLMVVFHQRAGTEKLTGVHKKYSLIKFGYVARSEPASFLLQTRI